MLFSKTAALSVIGALASAQHLSKPPLANSLDYLNQGLLDALHSTPSNITQWAAGWIPADCKSMTEDAGLLASDVSTFSVHYIDCGDSWILCRHKDSPDPLANMVDLFGKLPVQTRQYVRHVIALPNPSGGFAYNSGGNIAMFNRIDGDITVFLHESGHSLDLLGAYADKSLSGSVTWNKSYTLDSNVPDPYSQTNLVEDVARVTVVSSFDLNVPGGIRSVEPHWHNISQQFWTLQREAKQAGGLLVPGEKGNCTHRLVNSAAVAQVSSKRMTRSLGNKPNVTLSHDVKIIPPKDFHTGNSCKRTW